MDWLTGSKQGDAIAVQPLLQALNDKEDEVRIAACLALVGSFIAQTFR